MSLLDLFKPIDTFNTREIIEEAVKDACVQTVQPEPDEKPKEIGKWEWVEGYKGTDSDMICKGFKFELNKRYVHEEKIMLCNSGFHFCKTLKNVFNYYPIKNKGRYFKVKALVNMELMEEQRKTLTKIYGERYGISYINGDKLVAKEIFFIEEVSDEELLPYIKEQFSYVETVDDWNLVKKIGYESFKRNWFMNQMKDSGFGETFLCILYDNIKNTGLVRETINYAKALKEENVSKDMAVYLMMSYIKK